MKAQTTHIDFSDMNPSSQVRFLQPLALMLLEKVLNKQPIAGQLVDMTTNAIDATLQPVVWQADWRGNARYVSNASKLPWRNRYANSLLNRFNKGKKFNRLDILRITRFIAPSERWWRKKATNAIINIAGDTGPHFYPTQLVSLLQSNAWQDSAFQYQTMLIIDKHLSNNLICDQHGWKITPLHPNFYWLLILISAGELPSALAPNIMSKLSSQQIRTLHQLKQLATIQSKTENWAGFWEQWLLGLLCQQNNGTKNSKPDFFVDLPKQMQASIARLPLMKMMLPECWRQQQLIDKQELELELEKPQTKITNLSTKASINEAPPWYKQTLQQQKKAG